MESCLPPESVMISSPLSLLFVKLTSSFLTIHGHTYALQELVNEVTLKNHSGNGMQLLGGYFLLTLSVLMHISPYIATHYNTAAVCCMEIGFLPWRISSLTFSVLISHPQ